LMTKKIKGAAGIQRGQSFQMRAKTRVSVRQCLNGKSARADVQGCLRFSALTLVHLCRFLYRQI